MHTLFNIAKLRLDSGIHVSIYLIIAMLCVSCARPPSNLDDYGVTKGMTYNEVVKQLGLPSSGPNDHGFATLIDEKGNAFTSPTIGYTWNNLELLFNENVVTGSVISE